MIVMTNQENTDGGKDYTLYEMYAGMIFIGLLVQIVCIFVAEDWVYLAKGWWPGIIAAMLMAWHMQYGIEVALGMSEADAITKFRSSAIIRYIAAAVVMYIIYFTDIGNVLMYMGGLFTLKAAAYMQPLTHRIFELFKNKNKK